MVFGQGVYNLIVRRNQTFLATIFASAFALEIGFDSGADKIWDSLNRGRQWKDIKGKYLQAGGEDDDE